MSGTKVLEKPQVSNEDNKEDLLAIMRQMTVQAAPSDAQARAGVGGGGGGGASSVLDIGLGGSSSLFAAKSRRRTTGTTSSVHSLYSVCLLYRYQKYKY